MEDVLDLYHEACDPERPVVCFDETSRQLVEEVRPPIKAKPGRVERYDTEYQRNGTRNLFMFCEPKGGWRHVEVTERRTAVTLSGPAGEDPYASITYTQEYYEILGEAAGLINRARQEGRRIVAVTGRGRKGGHYVSAGAGAGSLADGGKRSGGACRGTGPSGVVHSSWAPLSHGGCHGDQFPPAKVHATDAGVCLCWAGTGAPSLPGGDTRRIPVLLVRRRHVDCVGCSEGGGYGSCRS